MFFSSHHQHRTDPSVFLLRIDTLLRIAPSPSNLMLFCTVGFGLLLLRLFLTSPGCACSTFIGLHFLPKPSVSWKKKLTNLLV